MGQYNFKTSEPELIELLQLSDNKTETIIEGLELVNLKRKGLLNQEQKTEPSELKNMRIEQ